MRAWILPLGLTMSATAHAGDWDDVSVSQLGTFDGQDVTDTDVTGAAYEEVVRTLGVAIANKALLPADTLGIKGFDIGLTNQATFIKAWDPDDPTAWQRVSTDDDPTRVIWVPSLTVRKGLPLSLEVGGSVGYLAFSRQAVVGGYGRWALIEGYRSFSPDLAIQVGYTRYVGNEELQLGVMDASATIGYKLGLSQLAGINHGTISPFLGVGIDRIKADTRLTDYEQSSLGVHALPCYTDDSGADTCDKGYSPVALSLGMQIQSNDAYGRLGGAWSPGTYPTVSFALGLAY